VLESVAMKRCDSARSGRRSVEKLDAAAVRRSKVGREEARRSKGWECLLQWGWADTAAGATAGHMARRGWQEVVAAHRHRTWAVAVRHRARLCVQEQRPESGQRLG
jgi:hypothetical protein